MKYSRVNRELRAYRVALRESRRQQTAAEQRERSLLVYGDDVKKLADCEARFGRGVYWLESVIVLRDLGLVERVPTPDNRDATWNLTAEGREELHRRFPDYNPPASSL